MEIDFSKVNLEYLIQARDLARADVQLVSVLLGIPLNLAQVIAEVAPEELTQVIEIKMPLLIPRQEPWWWERLFRAMRESRSEELKTVIEHLSLVTVPATKRS